MARLVLGGLTICLLVVSLPALATPIATGLKVELRADAGTGGVNDGDPVTNWLDQSPNGFNVSQPTASAKPAYRLNVVGGRPSVRFDGGDTMRRDNVLGSQLASANAATVYLVIRQAGSDAQNSAFGWVAPGDNRFLVHSTYMDWLYFQFGFGSAGRLQPAGWDDTFHVLECWGGSGVDEIRVDGSLVISQPATFNFATGSTANFILGGDTFGNLLTGDISELLIYDRALGPDERIAVTDYLRGKYDFNFSMEIPEPGASALLALGLGWVPLVLRRRK